MIPLSDTTSLDHCSTHTDSARRGGVALVSFAIASQVVPSNNRRWVHYALYKKKSIQIFVNLNILIIFLGLLVIIIINNE